MDQLRDGMVTPGIALQPCTIKCLISAPGRLLILQQFSPRDPAYCARVVYQILTFGHILRGA